MDPPTLPDPACSPETFGPFHAFQFVTQARAEQKVKIASPTAAPPTPLMHRTESRFELLYGSFEARKT